MYVYRAAIVHVGTALNKQFHEWQKPTSTSMGKWCLLNWYTFWVGDTLKKKQHVYMHKSHVYSKKFRSKHTRVTLGLAFFSKSSLTNSSLLDSTAMNNGVVPSWMYEYNKTCWMPPKGYGAYTTNPTLNDYCQGARKITARQTGNCEVWLTTFLSSTGQPEVTKSIARLQSPFMHVSRRDTPSGGCYNVNKHWQVCMHTQNVRQILATPKHFKTKPHVHVLTYYQYTTCNTSNNHRVGRLCM